MDKLFGYELILDLYECKKEVISSRKKLKEYVDKLCVLIDMKQYGDTLIPHFGSKTDFAMGYSLVQLIETSSITGHFSELWDRAYINIFSCKAFDYDKAMDFTRKFFEAQRITHRFLKR